jgi:hypothetical protein
MHGTRTDVPHPAPGLVLVALGGGPALDRLRLVESARILDEWPAIRARLRAGTMAGPSVAPEARSPAGITRTDS